jgi:hypothetical protein
MVRASRFRLLNATRSPWIAWREAGYDAFLMKDAHKSEIQGHLATFEKLQHAEQDVIR